MATLQIHPDGRVTIEHDLNEMEQKVVEVHTIYPRRNGELLTCRALEVDNQSCCQLSFRDRNGRWS
jgi:hypothetical protein